MTVHEYQSAAMRTAPGIEKDELLANAIMGLCGEVGECADIVKKHRFQQHELDREKLVEEGGDVAWYLALLAYALDVDLDEMLRLNIEKLKRRYKGDGFTAEESMNRPEYVLTRKDLVDYSAENPSLCGMLHNAMIKIERGVCWLEWPVEQSMFAAVIARRIPALTEWVNRRKDKPVVINVRVRG